MTIHLHVFRLTRQPIRPQTSELDAQFSERPHTWRVAARRTGLLALFLQTVNPQSTTSVMSRSHDIKLVQ